MGSSSVVPRDLLVDIQDIDGIGIGSFAQVGLVKNTDYAVKVVSSTSAPATTPASSDSMVKSGFARASGSCENYFSTITRPGRSTRRSQLRSRRANDPREFPSYQCRRNANLFHPEPRWAKQAVEAIRHVHSRRVIHGDLGSHNFLVQSDGTLALSDFGGSSIDGAEYLEFPPARYTRPKNKSARAGGPEPPSEQDDLFALGTLLYEISTGGLLYPDLDDSQISARFARQQHPSFAGVPPALEQIIVRCWAGECASADEVARHLDGRGVEETRQACCVGDLPCVGLSMVAVGFFCATFAVMAVAVSMRRFNIHKTVVAAVVDLVPSWRPRS